MGRQEGYNVVSLTWRILNTIGPDAKPVIGPISIDAALSKYIHSTKYGRCIDAREPACRRRIRLERLTPPSSAVGRSIGICQTIGEIAFEHVP